MYSGYFHNFIYEIADTISISIITSFNRISGKC